MKAFKKSDKILIVGGTGFIGGHLAQRCLKDTPNVSALGLKEGSFGLRLLSKAEKIHIDVRDKTLLKRTICKRDFNYIFNLGGYIDHAPYFNSGREVIETHFVGLMNLLDCIDKKALKGFLQIGSSDEYGSAPAPQKEALREMPIAPYSFAKTALAYFIQMLYRAENFPGAVVRCFLVYGPGQNESRFLPQIIKACLRGEDFKTSAGRQLRDFCYVEDVVEGMVKAILSPGARGKIINIASGVPVSIKDMINKVVTILGSGKPLWGKHSYRRGENMALYADISLARKLIGWQPSTCLDEGLKKTISWYKQRI